MEVKQRMEELTRELERHNHLYYVLDRPEIADYEYDAMLRELENLDRIPGSEGGDLYLVNGNMCKLADAGIFSGQVTTTEPTTEKEETPIE